MTGDLETWANLGSLGILRQSQNPSVTKTYLVGSTFNATLPCKPLIQMIKHFWK